MKKYWILTAVMCLALTSLASADFIAYNDCQANKSTIYPNVTTIGHMSGSNSGPLLDFASGATLPVTVTIDNHGAVNNLTGAGPVADFTAGTDAYNAFNGKVDFKPYVIVYGSAGWYVDMIFANLDSTKKYNLITTIDRGLKDGAEYTNRWTKMTILGAEDFTNSSSSGTHTFSSSLPDDSVSIMVSNDSNGYVAKWTDISPGTDGGFSVRFTHATNGTGEIPSGATQDGAKAYGPGGFMLQEVPEPATMALLALGGLALLKRRKK
jgi:hypothetical protein